MGLEEENLKARLPVVPCYHSRDARVAVNAELMCVWVKVAHGVVCRDEREREGRKRRGKAA
eukprot:5208222-Pleurochrysis_carterae.AAC.1